MADFLSDEPAPAKEKYVVLCAAAHKGTGCIVAFRDLDPAPRDKDGAPLDLTRVPCILTEEIDSAGDGQIELLDDMPDDPGLYVWTGNVLARECGSYEHPREWELAYEGKWRKATEHDLAYFDEKCHVPQTQLVRVSQSRRTVDMAGELSMLKVGAEQEALRLEDCK